VTDLSRYADLLAFLDQQHVADPDLRAAWVGGSAATGGYDDHSDLDVNVLAAPGTHTEVYGRLSSALTTRFSPTSLWELPESTYPEGRQLFATFDADPGALDGPTRLSVAGIDKQQVGEEAARIRRVRPPEPYKGKGIRYQGEVVRRKAGKAGKAK